MLKIETALEKLTNENLAIAQKITEVVIETTKIIEVARVELQKKTEEMQQLLKEQIEQEEKAEKSGDRNEAQRTAQAKALEEQIQASQKLQQELEKQQEAIKNQITTTRDALKSAETTLDKAKNALTTATDAVLLAGSKLDTAMQNKQNAFSRESSAEANFKTTDIALREAGREYNAARTPFNNAAKNSTLSQAELKESFRQLAAATGPTAFQLELKIITSFNSNGERPNSEARRLYEVCKAEYNNLNIATQVLDAAKANHNDSHIERNAARKNRASCNVAEIAARLDLKLAKREENIAQLLVEKNQEIINTLNASLNQLNQDIANLTLDIQNASQQTAVARTQLSLKPPVALASIPAASIQGQTTYSFSLTNKGLQFQPNSFQAQDFRGNITNLKPKLCSLIMKIENDLFKQFLKENGYTIDTTGIKKDGQPIASDDFNKIQEGYSHYRNADSLNSIAMSPQIKNASGGSSIQYSDVRNVGATVTPKPGVAPRLEDEQTATSSRGMQPRPRGTV